MMMNPYLYTSIAAVALFAPMAQAATWSHDLPSALNRAASSNKNVLVVFSGSDWCGPCMALKSDILDTAAFAAFADANFELVELDYPRNKQQSASLQAANQKHLSSYDVSGFPTVIALSPDGEVLAKFVGHPGSLSGLKSRLSKALVAEDSSGVTCTDGVCSMPDAGEAQQNLAESEARLAEADSEIEALERIVAEIERLGNDYEAIIDYTFEEMEKEGHSNAVLCSLAISQVVALTSFVDSPDAAAELHEYIVDTIVPAFEDDADLSAEVEFLMKIAKDLEDPEMVDSLIEDNK